MQSHQPHPQRRGRHRGVQIANVPVVVWGLMVVQGGPDRQEERWSAAGCREVRAAGERGVGRQGGDLARSRRLSGAASSARPSASPPHPSRPAVMLRPAPLTRSGEAGALLGPRPAGVCQSNGYSSGRRRRRSVITARGARRVWPLRAPITRRNAAFTGGIDLEASQNPMRAAYGAGRRACEEYDPDESRLMTTTPNPSPKNAHSVLPASRLVMPAIAISSRRALCSWSASGPGDGPAAAAAASPWSDPSIISSSRPNGVGRHGIPLRRAPI